MTTKPKSPSEPIQVSCSAKADGTEQLALQTQIKNNSDKTLYIFDSARMPYFIQQEDNSLLVLYGVHPPDPDVDYVMIEIPTTKPIDPGQVITYEVALGSLHLSNHYEQKRDPAALHGTVSVQCQVGWGETPILASERHKLSINTLLSWQHLAQAEPIQVKFS